MPGAAGPDLPPHLLAKRKRKQEEAAAATATTKETTADPTPKQPDSPAKKPRILGPSAPPALLSERPPTAASDSDSDSDYGPALPTGPTATEPQTQDSQSDNDDIGPAPPPQPTVATRDAWMTMPPTADSLTRLDPSRQRARGFNTSKNAASKTTAAQGPGTNWTETPEEKRIRLQNEVLGISSPAQSVTQATGPTKKDQKKTSEKDEETARRIKAHAEATRGPSLLEQHQAKKGGKEEEDDPSKRGFDWEKDMKAAPSLGRSQKKEMINRAGDFGSRFSGGGYL